MKSRVVIAACLLMSGPVLSGLALAQSLGEKSGVNATFGITPSTSDFVREAAIGDIFEIESSKLAVEKADQATKDFATQMIADHTKTSKELQSIVASDPNVPIPDALDGGHQSELDKLRTLNGGDFIKSYYDEQVSAHKAAVSLFERYAKSGDSAKLKSWAATTLPTLQHHLAMAQALDE
jgi:putative membrane protein